MQQQIDQRIMVRTYKVKCIETNNLLSSFTLGIVEYVAREMATNFTNSLLSKIKAGLKRKVKPK